MKHSAFIILLVFPLLLIAQDIDPIYLTLNGDITDPAQEISGLAWHKNDLILLPQYPKDVIYSIPKTEILEFLDSTRNTITPNLINWNTNGIEKKIRGFEGFESITFENDQVYLTIEAEKGKSNCGYLVSGTISDSNIELDPNSLQKVKTPVTLRNMTYETILSTENSIVTIYEVNSENVNPKPIYYQLNRDLKGSSEKPFPFVEFRLTDATALDWENKFWAINYFWPGDYELLKPNLDYSILKKKDIRPVERLLEFKLGIDNITRTDSPPININLSIFGDSRNWEGLVRLNDIGFLIATDKFPGTILAFLHYSK